MANNFKGGQASAVGTANVTVYTVPAGKKSILIELDVANITTANVTVDVGIANNASATPTWFIIKNGVVPVGDALQVVAGQKIVLDATTQGKAIMVKCSVASGVDVICSVLEDVL